jgi:copper resistance protein B
MNNLKLLGFAGFLFFLIGTAHAAETSPSGAPANWPEPVLDSQPHNFVLFDQLEYQSTDGSDALRWDVLGWFGGDYNRLWIETEGEHRTDGDGGEIERIDAQYGRLIAPFWDFQVGLGYQRLYGSGRDQDRVWAVIGFQGLAPYWFEVDANLRVSEDGDVSADLEAEYDLLLTQRLILQPRFEIDFAAQEVEDFGVGRGFNSVSLGLRLRYEVRRQFAPYIGLFWFRKLGDTADLARDEGEDTDDLAVVGGVRFWF